VGNPPMSSRRFNFLSSSLASKERIVAVACEGVPCWTGESTWELFGKIAPFYFLPRFVLQVFPLRRSMGGRCVLPGANGECVLEERRVSRSGRPRLHSSLEAPRIKS